MSVNAWWFQVPWSSYYLHWDDHKDWPDPWQLLSENIFCEVARGLGIMYTLLMLERLDIQDCCLCECSNGTVVQVNSGKYILNWLPDRIVNISSETGPVRRSLSLQYLQSKI
jgi:hypothetical protein